MFFQNPAPTAIFTRTAEIFHNLPLKWIAWYIFKTWQSTVAVWQANRNQLPRNFSRRFATTMSWHEIRSMSRKLMQCMTTVNHNRIQKQNHEHTMTQTLLSLLAADNCIRAISFRDGLSSKNKQTVPRISPAPLVRSSQASWYTLPMVR